MVHDGGYTSVFTVDTASGHLRGMWLPPTGGSWFTQDLSVNAGNRTGSQPNIANGQSPSRYIDVIYTATLNVGAGDASPSVQKLPKASPADLSVAAS